MLTPIEIERKVFKSGIGYAAFGEGLDKLYQLYYYI